MRLYELDHKNEKIAKSLFTLLKYHNGDFFKGGYHRSVFTSKLTPDTEFKNRWHYYYEAGRNVVYHFICDWEGIFEVDKIFRNGKKEKKVLRAGLPTEPINPSKQEINISKDPEQLKMF